MAFAFGFSMSSLADSGVYAAKLISPRPKQVLYPSQKIKIEWKSVLLHINLTGCEMELFLSLDGDRTFTMCITPILD